jgi:hypothetical protein
MKKVYYEKQGRRYVPISEYDSDFLDSFTKGSHLVISFPGGVSRRYNIDPNYAAMIAAGRVAEDAISSVIMKASELRRNSRMSKEMTAGQRAAWEKLVLEFGDDAKALEWPSAREAAEAAVKAMTVEAERLLTNESVRLAYEQFMLVAALSKDTENAKSS